MIWQNIAHDPSLEKANRISRLVSPKARCTPRHQGVWDSANSPFPSAWPG